MIDFSAAYKYSYFHPGDANSKLSSTFSDDNQPKMVPAIAECPLGAKSPSVENQSSKVTLFLSKVNQCLKNPLSWIMGFTGGSDGKESACNAGDLGSIPGWERFPGCSVTKSCPTLCDPMDSSTAGYTLQYSWLENSMDGGAWRATVHGVTKSQTLSD